MTYAKWAHERKAEEAQAKAAAFEAEFDAFIENLTKVRPAIVKAHKDTGAWGGNVGCPKCGKNLRWSMAQCNGHIHAACETKGCVSWME